MSTTQVSFTCSCGDEIVVAVKADDEYNIVCPKCGHEYRFTGASVLRWGSQSG